MKDDVILKFINEALSKVKDNKIQFKDTEIPELYPPSANSGDDDEPICIEQANFLEKQAKLTNCYRSYTTKNRFFGFFLNKFRKYLFREIDYRYGLIFKNQENLNYRFINLFKENEYLSIKLNSLKKELEKFSESNQSSQKNLLINSKDGNLTTEINFEKEYRKLLYPSVPVDYFAFESTFRGSEEDIYHKFKKYLPYFQHGQNVLDVASGRGEFLDLCRDNDINVIGVDINNDLCNYAKNKGHKVISSDIFDYFKEVDDNFHDGIFAAHILEHLILNDLINLIKFFFKKLKKDSYCIIETPNAESLYAMSKYFYLDLTHQKPLHPSALEFLFKQMGFTDVQVLRIKSKNLNDSDGNEEFYKQPEEFAIIAKK